MLNFHERLEFLMQDQGLTKKAFAEKTGLSPSLVSHLSTGRNLPGLEVLQRIINAFPTLNARWIIGNEQPMWIAVEKPFPSQEMKHLREQIEQSCSNASYELHKGLKTLVQLDDLIRAHS